MRTFFRSSNTDSPNTDSPCDPHSARRALRRIACPGSVPKFLGMMMTRCSIRMMAALALASALAGCRPRSNADNAETSSFPREETLYLGGLQWGEVTSFNPLTSEPGWPVPWGESNYNLLYEPLVLFNSE